MSKEQELCDKIFCKKCGISFREADGDDNSEIPEGLTEKSIWYCSLACFYRS